MSSSDEDESGAGRAKILLKQLASMCQGLTDKSSAMEASVPKILADTGKCTFNNTFDSYLLSL